MCDRPGAGRRQGPAGPVRRGAAGVAPMSRPPHPFPSAEEGLALHHRLLVVDPLAPSDICSAYLGPLLDWVERRFPTVDAHLCQTAVHQALLTYVQHPARYDEARGDLALYLRMAARSDLW